MNSSFKKFYYENKDNKIFNSIFEKWYKRGHWGKIDKEKIRQQQYDWYKKLKKIIHEKDFGSMVMAVEHRKNKVSREMFSRLTKINIKKKSAKYIKERLREYCTDIETVKFENIVNEKFSTGTKQFGTYYEVFEEGGNFQNEIRKIIKQSPYDSIRLAATDKKNPKLYAWHADMAHDTVKKNTNIKFDVGFTVEERGGKTELGIYGFGAGDWEKHIKNKKEIIKKVLKYIPNIKTFRKSLLDVVDIKEYVK